MQVFISYARTPADSRLAHHVADRLRKAGITPWLDDASLYPGQELLPALAKAIAQSDHGVFLVSQSWLDREHTAFELNEFGKRDPALVRRTPVFRMRREDLVVPPQLVKWLGIEWRDDDPDYDARFWQLLCAVRGTPPGSEDTWSARGRQAAPVVAPTPVAPPAATLRPSLRCDRAPQWTELDSLAIDPVADLVIVAGRRGQGHAHFLERVQYLLRTDPRRSIVTVDWPTRPAGREEFLHYLAVALDPGTAPSPAHALAARLAHSNLVLLHPIVPTRFDDRALVDYHRKWLPELVADQKAPMHVKAIQPIEWPEPRALDQVLGWLRLRGAGADDRGAAQVLINRVSARHTDSPSLRVACLPELSAITVDQLRQFCALVNLDERKTTWFLERIGRWRLADETFKAIDAYLPEARTLP